ADGYVKLSRQTVPEDNRSGFARANAVRFELIERVAITYDFLCTMTDLYMEHPATNGLCAMLNQAAAAEQAGNAKKKAALLNAYVQAVNAHKGKKLESAEAEALIAWAEQFK